VTAPELRQCPVTGRCAVIAPERAGRPLPATVAPPAESRPCPFCPGMEHDTPNECYADRDPGTAPNGPGWRLRVVPNKYPAVRRPNPAEPPPVHGRFATGRHELVIESRRHVTDPADLTPAEMLAVVRAYRDRVRALAADPAVQSVTVFKNVGRDAGASLDHAHSQIIALPVVPETLAAEWAGAATYFARTGECVFCAMLGDDIRRVARTERFAALTPLAPRFAYETWILPLRHASHFETLTDAAAADLAGLLLALFGRLRAVLPGVAYNLYLHNGAPRGEPNPAYHWHFELTPRTSQAAGFEWATGCYMVAVAPEVAARALRW